MTNIFHTLKINKVVQESSDSKSFVFDVPEKLKNSFQYKAGQYITVSFEINGEELRRSYSLSSAPYENKWRICVKQVNNGLVSTYMCNDLNEGDEIKIMAPEGRFTFEANPEKEAQYYLFAAGSGITPVMAIAREILENEPLSSVYLLYGNREEDDVIYKDELERMKRDYDGQFFIKYVISSKENKKGLLSNLFKKSKVELPYFPGRIGNKTIQKFIDLYPIKQVSRAYSYICGPGSMNEDVKAALVKMGFDKQVVFYESFGVVGETKQVSNTEANMHSQVHIVLDGKEIDLEMDRTKTVLDVLLDKGYDPPYSCTSGACSSCMAKITEGKVTMDVSHALDEDDIDDGYILTCQARVDSPKIKIEYD